MRDTILFFRSWLRARRDIASVMPSSGRLARAVCAKVAGNTRQVVMEFGPGTGPVTKELLREGVLTADSRLIIVESDATLAEHLSRTLRDPRVTVVHDTAERMRDILEEAGEAAADAVISGIPYSHFGKEQRDRLVRDAAGILKPGGTHVVYQVKRSVLPHLKRWFGNVEESIVLLNVPPLRVFEARKEEDGISAPRTSA